MSYHIVHISGRRILSYALLAIVIGSSLGGILWQLGETYIFHQPFLERFASHQELVTFVQQGPQDAPRSLLEKIQGYFQGFPKALITPQGGAWFRSMESGDTENHEYSTTNIQVEGVDEADIVKTDGTYLYIVAESTIYIVRAYPPETAQLVSSIALQGVVNGIFVKDDTLVVFQHEVGSYGFEERLYYNPFYYTSQHTSILIYDLEDRLTPSLAKNVTVDGSYFNSRMIGDHVYVIVNYPAVLNNETIFLPEFQYGNKSSEIAASTIYHTDQPDAYDLFTMIVALDLQNLHAEPAIETFLLGSTSCLFVSQNNIYLTSATYSPSGTNIHRIHIGDGSIAYQADGFVPGYVLNQFSMDENNEYFRIATSDGMANNVYVLDTELAIRGRLEGLAPREDIYSARFRGNRCYLVTFRKIDPLFVINLTDPANPQVLGKLKIPGYSDYLHPYDENHVIGVGKETIPAEDGDFSWYQGVKISLFDVSNVSSPKEVAKYEIGDRGTESPVLQDHKAFLFSKSQNLLVLPILLAEIDESQYPTGVSPYMHGEYVYQGAYVLNISPDGGITLRGRVTHLDNASDLLFSGYYYASPYSVKRSLYIEQVLYTISDKKVKANHLETLDEITVIELAL